jgi:hypothetical protein
VGDYQDCDGVWHYGETVPGYTDICAIDGTVTTVSGSYDLRKGVECAV